MGEKDPEDRGQEPSLELPTLRIPRIGRKKAAPRSAQKSAQGTVEQEPEEPTEELPPAEPEPETEPEPEPEPRRKAIRARELALPSLPGWVAAVVTGAVVGFLGTLLTYLALVGCEAWRGTSTCGGPGLLFLLAILIVMILVGVTLLKAWRVTDPGSTSFLGVGIVAVLTLLVLLEVIFSAWMFLVIPLVGAGAYALSHWVTTRFVEDESPGLGPDVR